MASKPIIDSNTVKKWISIGYNSSISNDGNYFMYSLFNPIRGGAGLIVQSTSSDWTRQINGTIDGTFSADSKHFFFQVKDTLTFLKLGTDEADKIFNISSVKQPRDRKDDWLAYHKNDDELVLVNLQTNRTQRFSSVKSYLFDNSGQVLLIKSYSKNESGNSFELKIIYLETGDSVKLWASDTTINTAILGTYSVSFTGNKVAFYVNQNSAASLWYYERGMDRAVEKINSQSDGIEPGLSLSGTIEFSPDEKYIYTNLSKASNLRRPASYVNVDVWNYKDTILQSGQINGGGSLDPQSYEAAINLNNNKVIRLWCKFGDIVRKPLAGDFLIVENDSRGDRFWLNQPSYYSLISLLDGSRIKMQIKGPVNFYFSPHGKLLIYDRIAQHYLTFDFFTKRFKNISISLPPGTFTSRLGAVAHPNPKFPETQFNDDLGIAKWLDTTKVLVYDDYDIWRLDLAGKERPLCITNSYGRKNKIKFRILRIAALDEGGANGYCLLSAFDEKSKESGLFKINLQRKVNPELLFKGPCTYFPPGLNVMHNTHFNEGMVPLKAKNKNLWIIKQQNANFAPNFFKTNDLQHFKQLTNIRPESECNWLQAELIKWKQPDGIGVHGILYKPENFDPQKKYPVLVVISMQYSQVLHEFPIPNFTSAFINIPWFVSRGYLVFAPDIHRIAGEKCESAYKSVITGVQAISKNSYVDSKKLALIGHSQSGQMVYYIISRSNLFSAAIAGAGITDAVSSSLSLMGSGYAKASSRMAIEESNQLYSVWENPGIYHKHSPILRANKITTPLIIFHSMVDSGVPWEQAVEMFTALRRNDRSVWMLQYNEGDHGVYGNDAKDYTIRINQFFDHFLKTAPAPKWMTSGIRASEKGVDKGFEFDLKGNCGSGNHQCKACKNWSKQ